MPDHDEEYDDGYGDCYAHGPTPEQISEEHRRENRNQRVLKLIEAAVRIVDSDDVIDEQLGQAASQFLINQFRYNDKGVE